MTDEEFLEELRRVLDYNPETGAFTWKITNGKALAGNTAGCVNGKGRLCVRFKYKLYYAYRLAWLLTYGKWPDGVVDHVDGNPLNNRLENLRDVSQSLNLQNQRKPHSDSKSKLLGVSWNKRAQRFRTHIYINGKGKHLGYFLTEEAAHAAYLTAKRELHVGNTL